MTKPQEKKNLLERLEAWANGLGSVDTPDTFRKRNTDVYLDHAEDNVRVSQTVKQFEQAKLELLVWSNTRTERWRTAVATALEARNTVTREDFIAQLDILMNAMEARVYQHSLGDQHNFAVTAVVEHTYSLEKAKLFAMVFSENLENIDEVALAYFEQLHGEKDV